jgi:hypothetical protein
MPPAATVSPAQLAISTKSSSSFELARGWLDECKSKHELCQHLQNSTSEREASGESSFLPTRLIDVSGALPRLVENTEIGRQEKYLALSHCWGGIKILRLLKGNFNDMKAGIQVEKLSQTFQDALSIIRNLGYRYIWIDSLCVIQDSEDDWRVEAKKMSEVYGNADATIAAIGADGNAGCFRRRNPLLRRPGKLTESSGTAIYGYGFLKAGEHNLLEDAPGIPGLSNLPLLRRAWVVQERLISDRVIYYGYEGLMWECALCTVSEFRPQIFPVPVLKYAEEPLKFILRRILKMESNSDRSVKNLFLEVWLRVMETYTRSALTFPTDRVAALAGIAGMIKSSTGMDYLAGLWVDLFPEALMWWPGTPQPQLPLPSWSWLSWNVPIIGPSLRQEENISDLTTTYLARSRPGSITKPANSVLGEVDKGELKVTGFIRKVYYPVDDDTGEIIASSTVYTKPTRVVPNQPSPPGYHKYYPAVNPHPEFDLHFLLLKRMRYKIAHRPSRGPEQTYEAEIEEQGLVIMPYAQDEGSWIRVGCFSNIHQADWVDETWEIIFPEAESKKGLNHQRTISLY